MQVRIAVRTQWRAVQLVDSCHAATGNKEQKVGLPDDVKIGIIMVKLVEKIKLPSTGPDGNPISYKFIHKVSGRQLLETQTLADAHIKDGDVLRLQPEITAGA